ncbi:hypothetical protein AAZX31_10G049900 [Glycine max]
MAWDSKQISKIVAVVGDMVDVDDDVELVRRMDRARVLLKTPWKPYIQHIVNVHIQGEVYNVHIVEAILKGAIAGAGARTGHRRR